MEETKKWYKSRTVQLAILQAAIGIVTALITNNPTLQDVGYIAIVKSILDFLLRVQNTAKII